MIMKEVILPEEQDLVNQFLQSFSLKLDQNINKTIYIEEDDRVIGTISCSDYIIKCLAIDPRYQSENLASKLINEMIQHFVRNNIYNYQVFTKPIYKEIFVSLGFKEIVSTNKVVMLEAGTTSIDDELSKIKNQLDIRFAEIDESSDIASIVINGNPITNGHMHLIEKAAINHNMVVVFIVEEDKSEFSFEERMCMAYLATHKYSNVYVLPSTKYIVSSFTFPTYFLKEDEVDIEYAKVDAMIFDKYFVSKLHLKKRYVGSESKDKMVCYNNTLKEVLKDKLEIVDRLSDNGNVVSASYVRKLISENKIDEALNYIPRENHTLIKTIVREKYGL